MTNENSTTYNRPLNEIVDPPPHLATEIEKIPESKEALDRIILQERKELRKHKQILFYSALIAAGVLYVAGMMFAVFSKQSGVAYFMGIVAFMTPATLITSVLLTRIIAFEKNKHQGSSDTLITLGRIIQEILKSFNK